MKIFNPLPLLDNLIDNKIEELQKYAQKAESKSFHIDKMNEEIKNLTLIYNTIEALKFLETWLKYDPIINNTLNADSQLSGMTIILRTRPTGKDFGYLEIDPFK